jgi:negative regulator of flagellin synthesis FlgM
MKIDPNLQSIANAQADSVQNAKTRGAQESSGNEASQGTQADGSDTVQFSGTFAEVQSLTSQLQQIPDVRADRVAELKAKIQQGSYNPDPNDVANALLNDSVTRGGNS